MSGRIGTVACIALLFAVGCNTSDFVPVSGVATHNGEPLADLFLKFELDSGEMSWATTDAQGHFNLISTDRRKGAAVGTHHVWVEHRPMEPMPGQDPTLPLVPWKKEVEDKYGRGKSELTVDIQRPLSNLQLELD